MPPDQPSLPIEGPEPNHQESGADYVPIDDIPLEWRPPEFSPRLKTYADFPVEMLSTIGASLGHGDVALTLAIGETTNRIAVCWTRLKDSYLEWFEPMGPPGVHAHLHYRSPQEPVRRSVVQSSMVVDYEASLIFLDVAFDLIAQAVGKVVGRTMSWQKLLAEAEKPDAERAEWLSTDVARAVRQIQRTVLYARNYAVAHPGHHYVVLRTDNTGNVTYLRLPVDQPGPEVIARLDALLRSKHPVRDNFRIDPSIADSSNDAVPPWLPIAWLDRIAGDLDDAERRELQELRELVGYTLPSVREIAEASETLLSGLVQYFGDRAAQRRNEAASTGSKPLAEAD